MVYRMTTHEISMHDICAVEIARPTGHSGRKWLVLELTDVRGNKTELAIWGLEDEAPDLIVEDDVPMRRVQTIGEGD